MKIKNIITKLGWRSLLYLFAFLVLAGVVAETQAWGRGWVHDLKYAAQCKFSRGSFSSSPDNYAVESDFYEYPDEPSPEMKGLQMEIDQWYPEAIKTYPLLEVTHRQVPDEQNGFLKIIEWHEEFDSAKQTRKHLKLPEDIQKSYDTLFSTDKREALVNEQLLALETYLQSQKAILDRAIAIGLLPEQSDTGIIPDRYFTFPVSFSKNIVDNLNLRAFMEAKHGDFEAAFLTLKSTRDWGSHIGDVEAPTLIMTTLASAIHLSVQNSIHSQILPLLLEKETDLTPWAEFTSYKKDSQEQWSHMWRGEWNHFIKARWIKQHLLAYNPRDTMNLVAAYSSMMNNFADPKTMTNSTPETPSSPDHLTRKSGLIFEELLIGTEAYGQGYLRTQALLKQYELAFALRRLESEGQDLKTLNQKTLDSLPLQIFPGNDLAINFDVRVISVPDDKFREAKPLVF